MGVIINKRIVTSGLIVGTMVIVSVCLSLVLDQYLINDNIKDQVEEVASNFAARVNQQQNDLIELEHSLPMPAECDPLVFKQLIYKHRRIKNIGVIKDNKIVCDAYQRSVEHKKMKPYSTFVNDDGRLIKYWNSDGYGTIVSEDGYFIEFDMNYFVNFNIPNEISGLFLIDRSGKKIWFEHHTHEISAKDSKKVELTLLRDLGKNDGNQLYSNVQSDRDIFFKLTPLKNGAIMTGTFAVKSYLSQNVLLSILNLTLGLLFGAGISGIIVYLYIKSQSLTKMLEAAITNRSLFMVYQPFVELQGDTRKIVGFEALLRWKLDSGEYIRPDLFIGIAEKEGLTHRLTKLIIDMVFTDLHNVLHQNPNLYVSINITPSDLKDDSLVRCITENLNVHQLSNDNIVVELTERAIADKDSAQGIQAIKDAKINISIDDFGTGVSNVQYLAELQPDIIKIDKVFVDWSDTGGPTSNLLGRLVSLCKEFNLKVVAEGVETEDQAERCQLLGVDIGQGFYWYKPMPLEDLQRLPFNSTDE